MHKFVFALAALASGTLLCACATGTASPIRLDVVRLPAAAAAPAA